MNWPGFILTLLALAVVVGYMIYLCAQPRKPDGCWYKPKGFLRDDNFKTKPASYWQEKGKR